MRFLCEVSVKASLWKCIWDEPWKKIGILRGERWKNTASWGNRVSVGFLLYKLYKPWVRFWKAMLLAVCFWIHKLSYKGWKSLHRKIAGFFFFHSIECKLYVNWITCSILFNPLQAFFGMHTTIFISQMRKLRLWKVNTFIWNCIFCKWRTRAVNQVSLTPKSIHSPIHSLKGIRNPWGEALN